MISDRRNFLRGLFAAPAIIAIDRLMPVKLLKPVDTFLVRYKGLASFNDWYTEAGLFYCPYVPLQFVNIDNSMIGLNSGITIKTNYRGSIANQIDVGLVNTSDLRKINPKIIESVRPIQILGDRIANVFA